MAETNNRLNARTLPDREVETLLKELPRWKFQNGSIHRAIEFQSHLSGADFVRRVSEIAEDVNHHPDLLFTWRKVEVTLTSHDVGGITQRDLNLARRVEDLARTFT